MDARAYVVATMFGFIGGLLVPRDGPDRRAVHVTLALMTAIGLVTWLVASDPYAGPSLTIGGPAAMLGTLIRRPLKSEGN